MSDSSVDVFFDTLAAFAAAVAIAAVILVLVVIALYVRSRFVR